MFLICSMLLAFQLPVKDQTVAVFEQNNTIVLGLAAVMASILSPILMAMLTNRNARKIKTEDWARQDQVAKQLMERQDLADKRALELATQTSRTALLQEESNKKMVEIAKVQVAKVEQIHTLVNSNLTASMQVQLEFAIASLTSMKELLDLKHKQGIEPDPKTLGVIAVTESKIAELKGQLRDRFQATTMAESNVRGDVKAARDPNSPIDPASSVAALQAASIRQANRIEDVGLDTNKDVKILKDRITDVEITQDKKKD